MSFSFDIASICKHKGEEPVVSGEKGICNVFFRHCNLQCLYCQNKDISRNDTTVAQPYDSLSAVLDRIEDVLSGSENSVGFVSPSHRISQVIAIMDGLHERNINPTYVYNTNGFDSFETMEKIRHRIDVFLPDFKYADAELGFKFSGVKDYPTKAMKAIKIMYYEMGASLQTDDKERVLRGLIVRHLVLPGFIENSKRALEILAEELSPNIHLSLMAQYFPIGKMPYESLNRCLHAEEYEEVLDYAQSLGFHRGWTQELSSAGNYHPHFDKADSFE